MTGVGACAECGARLVAFLPAGARPEAFDLVPIFVTADSSLLAVVKSALESAGIPFVVQGEGGMRLFPMGRFAIGVNKPVLGATILVREENAEEAKGFLASFEQDPGNPE